MSAGSNATWKHHDKAAPCTTKLTPVDIGDQLQQAYQMQKGSIFFNELPGEIRNKIYAYLLGAQGSVALSHQVNAKMELEEEDLDVFVDTKHPIRLCAAIIPTCRACAYETYPILYGHNVFTFYDSIEIENFDLLGLDCRLPGINHAVTSNGRLSLLRQMSLCIKNHPLWRFDNDNSLEPCWRTLFGRPWNLSVEHLYLDFSGSMIERHYLRELQDVMTETKPFYDQAGGTMGNLRVVTVKGLDYKPFFAQLRDFLKPEVGLLLEIGPPQDMCAVVADFLYY